MKKLLYVLICFMLFSTGAMAADSPKFAYVSAEKILSESAQAKAIEDAMTTRFGSRQESLQASEKELKEMEEDYKRNELVMTNDKLEELKKNIIGKYQLYNQQKAQLRQEVTQMRNEELAGLINNVKDIINDIAKQGNYDMIFRGEAVLFAADSYDITDTVIKKMDEQYNKNSKK